MSTEWTQDLVLDQPELDRQHAMLFARLQRATAALDGTTAEADAAVGKFADELMAHLAAEEALMEESLFPERTRHKSAHEIFVADFLRMRDELRELGPTPAVAEWLAKRLPEWLRFHIRMNDAPLAAHLVRRAQRPGDARQRKGDTRRLS